MGDSSRKKLFQWKDISSSEENANGKQVRLKLLTHETIERIKSNPTVIELVTFDEDGMVDMATVDATRAQLYKSSVRAFHSVAQRAIKNIDPRDEISFIRMRTDSKEITIAAEKWPSLLVIQDVEPYGPPTQLKKTIPDMFDKN